MKLLYVVIGAPTLLLLIAAIGIPITKHLDRKALEKNKHINLKERILQKRLSNKR